MATDDGKKVGEELPNGHTVKNFSSEESGDGTIPASWGVLCPYGLGLL